MTDASNTPSFQGNSDKQNAPQPAGPRVTHSVVTAGVKDRKPTLGQKFRSAFAGDDAQTVGQYILFDVLVPATKNLLFDVLIEGARRSLWGGGGGGRAVSGVASSILSGGNRAGYSKVYSNVNGPSSAYVPGGGPQPVGQPASPLTVNEFTNFVFNSRGDAEMVLDNLNELIDRYDTASVADFLALVGKTATMTDTQRGWAEILGGDLVQNIREGYVINLPRPVHFKS